MRTAMIGVAVLCAILVVAALAVPEGEIITVNVVTSEGRSHPVQLWVVEVEGSRYLRAGNPKADWLAELRATPAVTIGAGAHAGEVPIPVLAEAIDDDPKLRQQVAAAMGRKYGIADRIWAALRNRDESVPVRLTPRPPEPSP